MLIALIAADIIMLISFVWRFPHLPPQIPLFYSQLWGENQLGDLWFIVIIPILMHIFFFLNSYVYRRYFWQDHTIKHIITVSNWIVIIMFTGIFLKIIFLVT